MATAPYLVVALVPPRCCAGVASYRTGRRRRSLCGVAISGPALPPLAPPPTRTCGAFTSTLCIGSPRSARDTMAGAGDAHSQHSAGRGCPAQPSHPRRVPPPGRLVTYAARPGPAIRRASRLLRGRAGPPSTLFVPRTSSPSAAQLYRDTALSAALVHRTRRWSPAALLRATPAPADIPGSPTAVLDHSCTMKDPAIRSQVHRTVAIQLRSVAQPGAASPPGETARDLVPDPTHQLQKPHPDLPASTTATAVWCAAADATPAPE